MNYILAFIIVVLRLVIFIKVGIFLFNSRNGFESNNIDVAVWWILFLAFDVWLGSVLPKNHDDYSS
jgi:hypothetical protein